MRKANKTEDSGILADDLKYIPNNSTHNKKLKDYLLQEQKSYCAYTDEYIGRADASDIDHFNPNLKNTEGDSYTNWFLIKNQWNKEKGNKWEKFQPVLHPTSEDFEERIAYHQGDYFAKNGNDIEASNLVSLLKLDDLLLAEKRKKYINRKRSDMEAYGEAADVFFANLINDDNCQVSYVRAIKEEFGVDVWPML
ncbi:HNH endonuclease [Chitinophaga sp. YR627]|uniref:HNH endonuclease domain-containing protein n=1 Tax=Chitinophaga sp. YR627 TaxID=1881041 RepID=UPI0008F1938E|nr:HNH endonuclease domain-containing protein [Chitinophaga sp. YR627]SFN74766.1 HNH endonuclease [Chitinophaga sp. YR627]